MKLKKLVGFLLMLLLVGCTTSSSHLKEQTLVPTANTNPVASQALLEGNRFFAEHQWTAAKRKFKAAIHAHPTLAEAHYNLAITLEQQGHFPEARSHYKKTMDLAPDHPVIRNAPPFRQYGTVQSETIDEPSEEHGGHQH
jgi:Tfp pilus assembly protein PilF